MNRHSALFAAAAALLCATSTAFAQAPSTAAVPSAGVAAAADPALVKAAAEPGALVRDTGLVYRSLKDGSGPSPKASDTVRVHYRGFFPDGREFDSSYARGQPAEFPLDRVIRCWTEGVALMKVGGKARLSCPSAIAYGPRGTPGGPIPPNATLQFEVELLGIR